MGNQRAKSRKVHFGWRGSVVFILSFLGILALVAFGGVHWTERQLLTTDNYVKIVAPLPKNDQVATALSDYTVNALFANVDVSQKISDVLPPRADFLAPTLASQLKTSLTKQTKNIIQSDQFQNIWVTANRTAHQRLMAQARQTMPAAPSKVTKLNIQLSALKDKAAALLGKNNGAVLGSSVQNAKNGGGLTLGAKLKTSVATFGDYVRKIDFLNGVLGLLALVCLVGAATLSYRRRRLVIILGAAILVVGLLQLIGVKALRPEVLNQVQNASFRPAAGVVYDNLVATFHRTAMAAVVVGAVLALVAWLSQPSLLRRNQTITKLLDFIQHSYVRRRWRTFRLWISQHRWPVMGGVTLLTLLLLAFAFNPDGQDLIRALLLLLLGIECINLVAARPRSSL